MKYFGSSKVHSSTVKVVVCMQTPCVIGNRVLHTGPSDLCAYCCLIEAGL